MQIIRHFLLKFLDLVKKMYILFSLYLIKNELTSSVVCFVTHLSLGIGIVNVHYDCFKHHDLMLFGVMVNKSNEFKVSVLDAKLTFDTNFKSILFEMSVFGVQMFIELPISSTLLRLFYLVLFSIFSTLSAFLMS